MHDNPKDERCTPGVASADECLESETKGEATEYIVIPGQYTGDMWHVAAAMSVQPHLWAVIVVVDEKDRMSSPALLHYLDSIGFRDRVIVHVGKVSKATRLWVDQTLVPIASMPGKQIVWQYTAYYQSTVDLVHRSDVYSVYQSTAYVMKAIERHGKVPVVVRLRSGLTRHIDLATCQRVATVALDILSTKRELGPVLFVMGRVARYNSEHDLTPLRLKEIVGCAREGGYSVVVIGDPAVLAELCDAAALPAPLDVLDLRDWLALTGSVVNDERARAYFWWCISVFSSSSSQNIKLIGGRSGSTDLAAFMGVDVLCWDICDVQNPEYLRLLITEPSLLSVTHVGAVSAKEHGRAQPDVTIEPVFVPQLAEDLTSFLESRSDVTRLRCQPSRYKARKRAVADLVREALVGFRSRCESVFHGHTCPDDFDGRCDRLAFSSPETLTLDVDLAPLLRFQDGSEPMLELAQATLHPLSLLPRKPQGIDGLACASAAVRNGPRRRDDFDCVSAASVDPLKRIIRVVDEGCKYDDKCECHAGEPLAILEEIEEHLFLGRTCARGELDKYAIEGVGGCLVSYRGNPARRAILHDIEKQLSLALYIRIFRVEHLECQPLRFANPGDSEADKEPCGRVVLAIEAMISEHGEENGVLEELTQEHHAFSRVGHEMKLAHIDSTEPWQK